MEEAKTAKYEKEKYEKLLDELEDEKRKVRRKLRKEKSKFKAKTKLITHAAVLPNWLTVAIILIMTGMMKEQFLGFISILAGIINLIIKFPYTLLIDWGLRLPLSYGVSAVIMIVELIYYSVVASILFYFGAIVIKSYTAFQGKAGHHYCRYICADVAIIVSVSEELSSNCNLFVTTIIIWLLYWVYLYIKDWWRVRVANRDGDYSPSRKISVQKGDLFLFSWIYKKLRKVHDC